MHIKWRWYYLKPGLISRDFIPWSCQTEHMYIVLTVSTHSHVHHPTGVMQSYGHAILRDECQRRENCSVILPLETCYWNS